MLNLRWVVASMATGLILLSSGCADDQAVYPDPERDVTEEDAESVVAPPDGDLYPDEEEEGQKRVPQVNVVNPPDEAEQ